MAVDKKINLDLLEGLTERLTKRLVLIGIPSAGQARKAEEGEKVPPSNALLGYVHEFGLPEKNIPARPFLMPGIWSAKDRIVAVMKKGAEAALAGDEAGANGALTKAGMIAVDAVQQRIEDGPFAPLSERTKRARKGEPPYRPLIDTGQLRRSVTYVIKGD